MGMPRDRGGRGAVGSARSPAAVDFSSEFQNLALHCGYVVWQEQLDGSFAIVREEDNVIEKTMVTKLKPGDLERIRAQYRC